MEKKIPYRLCVVCRESKPKKELLRIVKSQDGKIELDKTGKLNGRGTYICNNKDCLENLFKKKVLNKAFKCNIPAEVYEGLKEQFVENREN